MGNFNTKQQVDTWNEVNTEDISSTIPYMRGMNQESTDLANVLSNYLITETDSEKTNKTFMKKYNIVQNKHNERTSTELSATSPFITSDLYNKMVTNNMQGGGKDDSSSTSTTSDYENKKSSISTDKMISKLSAEKTISKSEISTKESPISQGEFSYQSSSAHTGGSLSSENNLESPSPVEENNSDTGSPAKDDNISSIGVVTDSSTEVDENNSKENVEKTSEEATTIANDESEVSKNKVITSSEVNTSDINMVSINTE
tara:strand:- start:684 stop:1460 length:777 start_codon:yes stop_codon:yes gene_type:complete